MPKAKKRSSSKPVVSGTTDELGRPHGRGSERFPSGDVFEGRFCHGEKHGKGSWIFSDGSRLTGTFRNDDLHGLATYSWPDGSEMRSSYREGQLNGLAVKTDAEGAVECTGHHIDDERRGRWYEVVNGYGAFLVGHVSDEGVWSGADIAYVYPDRRSALLGRFCDGELVEGVHATCSGDCEQSYCVTESKPDQAVQAFVSTNSVISKQPLIADLYETAAVYVAASLIHGAGEGLFAKRALAAGELVAFYNGIRLSHGLVDARDWKENGNCISLDKQTVIDVPEEYIDTAVYCATLGHKANHSFTPNSRYAPCYHPIYGDIKCVETLQDVAVDEEITVHYDYQHTGENGDESAPDWYISSKPNGHTA